MGANAQTSVPTFTAGDVLTAANMNISARTGVPVFADTTARDAAFGGTGEKVLAEGQLCYVENLTGDAQIQYYDGSTWNSLGAAGLTLISSTTIGTAVSSVTVSNAFSSTYDNYRIMINGGTTSTTLSFLFTLGASATGYYRATFGRTYGNTDNSGAGSNATSFLVQTGANGFGVSLDVFNPFLTYRTGFVAASPMYENGSFVLPGGYHDSAASYTAFTITTSTGTITGGTIRVYGYKN